MKNLCLTPRPTAAVCLPATTGLPGAELGRDIFWDKINHLDLRIWSKGDGDDYGRGSGGHFLRQDQSVESLNCNIIDQVDGDDYDRGSGGHFLRQDQSVESVNTLSTAY